MKIIKIFFILIIFTISSCVDVKDHFSKSEFVENIENFAGEKQYVMGTDDIPLFFGLELLEDDSSNFDTTLGNIVVSKYFGDFKLKVVKDFYLETLPQLGWKLAQNQNSQISFSRENDKLEIKLSYASKGLYVRFFVSSAIR